jgi:hypothetical protein
MDYDRLQQEGLVYTEVRAGHQLQDPLRRV